MLSVIVCVYNGNAYLATCLASLRQLDVPGLEIVMIDDGSQDGSLASIRAVAQEIPGMVVHANARNMGLGASRNLGVRMARNPYVTFMDCDDVLDGEGLRRSLEAVGEHDADMGISPIVKAYANGACHVARFGTGMLAGVQSFDLYISRAFETWSAASKIYRKSLITDNSVMFREGVLYEDVLFGMGAHLASRRALVMDVPYYVYRQDNPSITRSRTYSWRHVFSSLMLHNDIVDFFDVNEAVRKSGKAFGRAMEILLEDHFPRVVQGYSQCDMVNDDASRQRFVRMLAGRRTPFAAACLRLAAGGQ